MAVFFIVGPSFRYLKYLKILELCGYLKNPLKPARNASQREAGGSPFTKGGLFSNSPLFEGGQGGDFRRCKNLTIAQESGKKKADARVIRHKASASSCLFCAYASRHKHTGQDRKSYFLILLLAKAPKPSSPDPRRSIVAGSGTAQPITGSSLLTSHP